MNNQTTIGILGSGTWGIALARLLHRNGHDVTVWSRSPKKIENLSATRTHPALPGLVIPETVHFTCDLQTVASGKDILLFAVPSIAIRQTAESARPFIPDGQIIVDVAKGIEPDTLMTMTEVIRDELSKDGQHDHVKLVALSGPTHAEEVALDMPTSIVSACTDMQVAETVQDVFMNTCMRTYTNTDVLGVELCGAMKNIEALAVGISSGLGNGDNARARPHHARHCRNQPSGAENGLRGVHVRRTGGHRRPHRDGDVHAQPQQPLRYSHRTGCSAAGSRSAGRHGGGHQRAARRHAADGALSGGNADCQGGERGREGRNQREGHGAGAHDARQDERSASERIGGALRECPHAPPFPAASCAA